MKMLKSEMLSLVTYWKERIRILSTTIIQTSFSGMFSRGSGCLLRQSKCQAIMVLSKATNVFKDFIELECDSQTLSSEIPDSEDSDSDMDCDT